MEIVSGETVIQSAAILKSLPKDERQAILKEGNIISNEISAADVVALKASLGVPWEKLKTMGR